MFNFLSKQIKPQWQYQKSGNLWRMLFLEDQKLIIEHRSSTEKKVSFVLLDQKSGKPEWDDFILYTSGSDQQGKPVGDGWWVGMEYVLKDTVYFHSYSNPNNPEHMGIWAVDTKSKHTLWAREDLTFICANQDNTFLCYQETNAEGFAERKFLIVDAQNGDIKNDLGFDVEKANTLRNSAYNLEQLQNVILPHNNDTDSSSAEQLISQKKLKVKPERLISGLDLIVENPFTIVGFHEQTDLMVNTSAGTPVQALNYELRLYNENSLIYSDSLGKAMSGLIMDGFFLTNKTLYYVKERDTLVCVALEQD
jgi:hypothetical protein